MVFQKRHFKNRLSLIWRRSPALMRDCKPGMTMIHHLDPTETGRFSILVCTFYVLFGDLMILLRIFTCFLKKFLLCLSVIYFPRLFTHQDPQRPDMAVTMYNVSGSWLAALHLTYGVIQSSSVMIISTNKVLWLHIRSRAAHWSDCVRPGALIGRYWVFSSEQTVISIQSLQENPGIVCDQQQSSF